MSNLSRTRTLLAGQHLRHRARRVRPRGARPHGGGLRSRAHGRFVDRTLVSSETRAAGERERERSRVPIRRVVPCRNVSAAACTNNFPPGPRQKPTRSTFPTVSQREMTPQVRQPNQRHAPPRSDLLRARPRGPIGGARVACLPPAPHPSGLT